jgi:hypothetical protein
MGVREVRRARAVRRIGESAIATVVGGMILWSLTSSMSHSTSTTEKPPCTIAPDGQSTAATDAFYKADDARPFETMPSDLPRLLAQEPLHKENIQSPPLLSIPAISAADQAPAPPVHVSFSRPAFNPTATAAPPPPKRNPLPFSIPFGTILMYENFSRYREGDAAGWGPNTFVKSGVDRRHWLVSDVDGSHPVGRKIRLPNEFSWECRYSANLIEVTRGVLGWWKEPVTTRISFFNEQGARYSIEWVVKYGSDPAKLNPIGSTSLYAKKYYHTIRLPDGSSSEVGVLPPTGLLRIDRDKSVVKVSLDGQPALVGTMNLPGQASGFEIEVVNAQNGTLFFTDFKVSR